MVVCVELTSLVAYGTHVNPCLIFTPLTTGHISYSRRELHMLLNNYYFIIIVIKISEYFR